MGNEHPSISSGDIREDIWNKFVVENNGLFLQSWEWGEFQESLGRKIWRMGNGGEWQALVIKYDLPMGKNYLYCPGGPVVKLFESISPPSSNEEGVGGGVDIENQHPSVPARHLPSSEGRGIFQAFLKGVQKIAKQEKSIFLRVELFWEINIEENCSPIGEQFSKNLANLGFCKSDGGQRILQTLVLDLSKTEEALLAGMKQKTRYNIRLAEKHGVKARISKDWKNDFESFWQLAQETAKRDGFGIHAKKHYEKLFSACHSRESGNPRILKIELFLAEYESKAIAANIIVFFGGRAIYLHGASANESRNLMAPYLLQWEQIKESKRRGCEVYNFWGVDEKKWPGVTRFKKGFGGEEISYVGAYDYVFDKMWYGIYKAAKKFSRK